MRTRKFAFEINWPLVSIFAKSLKGEDLEIVAMDAIPALKPIFPIFSR